MGDPIPESGENGVGERRYRRNYIALLLDGFFFSFSSSIFSYTTVLPVYVSNLSENRIFISLLAVLFFSLSNGAAVLSCVIGVNTRSPKWAAVIICMTQRAGFFLIFLSTWAVTGNRDLAICLFFFSYAVYGVAAGMSGPVHSTLVSRTIYRNVASFYGTYSLSGALAGIISAQGIRILLERYSFPVNYSRLFLLGMAVAMLSTLSLAAGISETKAERRETMNFSRLPFIFRKILAENKRYRRFLLARIFAAMAEMCIPFYIIRVKSLPGAGEGIVGIMTTVLLVSNMVGAKIIGRIGDRSGPSVMMRIAAGAGILAAVLALLMPSPVFGYLLFVLVSASERGTYLATSVANIRYSEDGMVSVYAALSGIVTAPFYALFAFGGGLIANRFSLAPVFGVSALFYAVSLLCGLTAGPEHGKPFSNHRLRPAPKSPSPDTGSRFSGSR
jgi:MFS family permease